MADHSQTNTGLVSYGYGGVYTPGVSTWPLVGQNGESLKTRMVSVGTAGLANVTDCYGNQFLTYLQQGENHLMITAIASPSTTAAGITLWC